VYFLKVSFVLQSDIIYGISTPFSMIDRDSMASLQVSSQSKYAKKDMATITWKAVATRGTRAPYVVNNATLPFVSIFLIGTNENPVEVVTHYPSNQQSYAWRVPSVDSADYQWKVCYSSGLLDNINCALSSDFSLTGSGLPLTTLELIIGGAAIFVILVIVLVVCIVCVKRRRRRQREATSYHRSQRLLSENAPLLQGGPSRINAPLLRGDLSAPSAPSAPNAPSVSDDGAEGSTSYVCKICYENPLDILLLPCNHLCICEACANSSHLLERCPVCNGPIERKQKIFVP